MATLVQQVGTHLICGLGTAGGILLTRRAVSWMGKLIYPLSAYQGRELDSESRIDVQESFFQPEWSGVRVHVDKYNALSTLRKVLSVVALMFVGELIMAASGAFIAMGLLRLVVAIPGAAPLFPVNFFFQTLFSYYTGPIFCVNSLIGDGIGFMASPEFSRLASWIRGSNGNAENPVT